jgi:glycosyltransferase involved in cell wall biosynthesis
VKFPTLSVIIPCHNGERFLAEAIESVLAQTIPATEIIVVDDGSTDSTQAIATAYPQVRYLYQPQQGVSVARNLGLKASQGEYIVFLDHDDRLLPQAFELAMQAFQRHPDCGFVFGLCCNIDANGVPLPMSARAVLEQPYDRPFYANILMGNSVHPPARHLFQRSVFERVGGFDPTLVVAEDYDMYLRVAAAFPGHCHNQVVVEYREHNVSASTMARPTLHLLASLKVLGKQKPVVRGNPELEAAYQQGQQHWCHVYGRYLAYDLATYFKSGQLYSAALSLYLLSRYYPQGLVQSGMALLTKLSKRQIPTHFFRQGC